MMSRVDNLSTLRSTIIADTKMLLRGLKIGATDDQLKTIYNRIRERERQLLHQEGVVLDPDMWRFLHSRLIHRNLEFADPNS
jgi:hypothetical protein